MNFFIFHPFDSFHSYRTKMFEETLSKSTSQLLNHRLCLPYTSTKFSTEATILTKNLTNIKSSIKRHPLQALKSSVLNAFG